MLVLLRAAGKENTFFFFFSTELTKIESLAHKSFEM